ncbi:hypothetical protein [Burkholderia contaminans]|nr:hypothetical protein [Burkholderia contaminans]
MADAAGLEGQKIAKAGAIPDVIRGASSIISRWRNNDLETKGWRKNFC